ncbi:cation diffusion facilitator family transporter [Victivallis sp. Marseille-Q1083]|uniref:cation diffusion facilitator family transporter n=1 Tax=Victivallis sp. Marseille-Q1083 TaxID=2717288 RepID=UPI00158B69E1|nr:cation diffusion facilitator family transporter [Victivallis sp. Marseille-Q1083]
MPEWNKQNLMLAKLEGYLSVFGNFVLFGFKFYVGWLSGSVAIIADAWHTLSDILSSVVLLIGLKISERPADKQHPFGHGRAELIAALLIGVMLAAVAVEFFGRGIAQLRAHAGADYGPAAVWAMVISVVVKEAMAQYAYWAGRRTKLSSLVADGHHHRSDAVSSLIVLIGIGLGRGHWWVDGVLSMLVALLIGWAAWGILKAAVSHLLGKQPSPELIAQVRDICRECCGGNLETHHFHLHEYGQHRELTFHIRLPGERPLREVHDCTQRLEEALQRQLGIAATIHPEPLNTGKTS